MARLWAFPLRMLMATFLPAAERPQVTSAGVWPHQQVAPVA
jgi:hypothetical protein